jgi:hypothetical protein
LQLSKKERKKEKETTPLTHKWKEKMNGDFPLHYIIWKSENALDR